MPLQLPTKQWLRMVSCSFRWTLAFLEFQAKRTRQCLFVLYRRHKCIECFWPPMTLTSPKKQMILIRLCNSKLSNCCLPFNKGKQQPPINSNLCMKKIYLKGQLWTRRTTPSNWQVFLMLLQVCRHCVIFDAYWNLPNSPDIHPNSPCKKTRKSSTNPCFWVNNWKKKKLNLEIKP